MKKKLQILTLTAALISCGTAMAQNSSRVIIPFNGTPGSLPAPSASGPEAVSCGPDALDYVYSKVDTLGMDSLFYFALWPTEKTSTAYANTQTVTITNVFVFGKVATGDPGPADMQVSIWNVNSNWQPTTMIAGATASLSIAQAASPAYHLFTFTTPVTVSDSFAVVLTNNDASDDFWAVASDGDPNTGAWLEGLSWYDWQGMWKMYIPTQGKVLLSLTSPTALLPTSLLPTIQCAWDRLWLSPTLPPICTGTGSLTCMHSAISSWARSILPSYGILAMLPEICI
jgi:hypothetical protein